jgi:general secretion pathway protein G
MSDFCQRKKGFTLVEIVVTMAIMALLATLILPVAKTAVKREKEIELRRNLRLLREAIDAYKKLADEKKIEVEEDSEGYPPDLETLVKGVEVKGGTSTAGTTASGEAAKKSATASSEPKTVKFLRRIPKDPMTDSLDWGLRSYQDKPDSDDWGGENVYDVYTKSNATALDGTKYKDW